MTACDRRGPGGECVRDHQPCPDFPEPIGYDGQGAPLYAHQLPPDPFYDETSCPIAECDTVGEHTHDNDDPRLQLNRKRQEGETLRLAVGETCLECGSTALVPSISPAVPASSS